MLIGARGSQIAALALAPWLSACAEEHVHVGTPVWATTDEAIEVDWWSAWSGDAKFKGTWSQLTVEQQRSLRVIERVDHPELACVSDAASATLIVTGPHASVRSYVAESDADNACDVEDGFVHVRFAQVLALLRATSCLPTRYWQDGTVATAHHIGVSDGCYHGIFGSADQPMQRWYSVDVRSTGSHRFAVHDCGEHPLRLAVFDEAGVEELESIAGLDEGCPVLHFEAPGPGTYAFVVEQLRWVSGDFYLTVDRVL